MNFNYKRNLASRIVLAFLPSLVVFVLRHNHLVGPVVEGQKVASQVAPPESIGEEKPMPREDRDEPESEEEQRSSVLFTLEQLEVLLKMGRPDFSELVAALKTGAAKGERFQPAKPGNFDGARDRKVVDAWLAKMELAFQFAER
jgi:hypothetical protein